MGDFSIMFEQKIMSRLLKSNQSPNEAPDYSTIVLASKMCNNSHEHSMYIN